MGRRRAIELVLVCAVLVAIAYGNSLHNGFHFDDGHSIQDNVFLRDLSYVPRYFTDVSTFSPLAENRSYRPLLLISFAISHAMGGGAPWAYHVVTMLLHLLGAFVVGALAYRFFKTLLAAYLAAAIFAVHPILSESVNYISARSSLMGSVLLFCTVLAYVRAREGPGPEKKWLAITNVVLLIALGTKLLAITVPALLIAYEVLLGPSRDKLRADAPKVWAMRLVPPAAIAFGFAALHEMVIGATARGARSSITPVSHLLTQTRVWQRYQALYAWPEDLCADLVMRWSEVPWEGETARAILWTIMLVAVAFAVRKRMPAFAFGVVWFYVTLSPTNSIVPLAEPATEHRVYVAMPGLVWGSLAILFTLLGERLKAPLTRRAVAIGAAFVLGGATLATTTRNRVWKDEATLWSDVIECAPTNGRAHLNYGRALFGKGDLAGARKSYEQCLMHWPAYAFCYINLVVLDLEEKRSDLADQHITMAEQLAPTNVYTHLWRGEVDLAAERYQTAEAAFGRALTVAPGLLAARRGLAQTKFELGRLDEAKPELEALGAQNGLYAPGWFALGYLAEADKDEKLAEQRYNRALRIDPRYKRARFNLARLLHGQNRLDAAIPHYRHLQTPDALFNLALALVAQGKLREAGLARDQLRRLAPGYHRLSELQF